MLQSSSTQPRQPWLLRLWQHPTSCFDCSGSHQCSCIWYGEFIVNWLNNFSGCQHRRFDNIHQRLQCMQCWEWSVSVQGCHQQKLLHFGKHQNWRKHLRHWLRHWETDFGWRVSQRCRNYNWQLSSIWQSHLVEYLVMRFRQRVSLNNPTRTLIE